MTAEANQAQAGLMSLTVGGDVRLKSAVSMLFTDILSRELTEAMTAPPTISMLQKYLKDRQPGDIGTGGLEPIVDNIPQPVLDIVQEAVFCSGALLKSFDCLYDIRVGDPLRLTGQHTFAELEMRDGILRRIMPAKLPF